MKGLIYYQISWHLFRSPRKQIPWCRQPGSCRDQRQGLSCFARGGNWACVL